MCDMDTEEVRFRLRESQNTSIGLLDGWPNGKGMATAGQDRKITLAWNVESTQEFNFFSQVGSLSWNPNRSALQTASPQSCTVPRAAGSLFQSLMHRQIRPHKVLEYPYSGEWASDGKNSGSGVLMTETCGTLAPPLAISFAKKRGDGHILAVADEEGFVNIFNTNCRLPSMIDCQEKTELVRSAQWIAHTNAIFDICWIKDDTHMLTASGDQTVQLWDVERKVGVGVMKGHTGSVKSICAHPSESDLFVSGARDGCVAFWDVRIPSVPITSDEVVYEPVAKVTDAHKSSHAKYRSRKACSTSVTAVIYLKDERVVATAGSKDGVVKYWDTRKLRAPVAQTPPKVLDPSVSGKNGKGLHGVAGLSQNPSGKHLIAICLDSKIYMYNAMRPEGGVVKTFSGHMMKSFYIKAAFSPDGSHILSGSSDNNAYLWEVNAAGDNPKVLEGHDQEVTAVAWCPTDFCKIATCSDDYTVRVWSMKEPRFAKRSSFLSTIRHPPTIAESEVPKSSCAHVPSDKFQVEQKETLESETNNAEIVSDSVITFPSFEMSHSCEQVTPSKSTREIQRSAGEELHQPMEYEQESPQGKAATSPSSVLNPPGSISRRRKTIVDYYGLHPQSS